MMEAKTTYQAGLKKDLEEVIDSLNVSELQKRFLRSRWLDQVVWMEGQAARTQARYYTLRLVTIIGGVMVPTLVGLKVGDGPVSAVMYWLILTLSLLVALSAAVEEFFHYGERWQRYRRTVERLKIAGWQFFQLSGVYSVDTDHTAAFKTFVTKVEEVLQEEVTEYIRQVQEQKEQREKVDTHVAGTGLAKADGLTPRQLPVGASPQMPAPGVTSTTHALTPATAP